jgi:hypothetical protein
VLEMQGIGFPEPELDVLVLEHLVITHRDFLLSI